MEHEKLNPAKKNKGGQKRIERRSRLQQIMDNHSFGVDW
jgi:hypothetical protein